MNNEMQHLLSSAIPDDLVLSSAYEIEPVLLLIKEMDEKIDYLKGLKKYRAEVIDNKIDEIDNKARALRNVIIRTMTKYEPKKTTLHFPSVGKVTKRKSREDWEIIDATQMLEFLQKQGVRDQVVRIEEKIDSSAVKKVLDNFEEQNSLVPGTKKIVKPESISIAYDDEDEDKLDAPKSKKIKNQTLQIADVPKLTASDL